MRAGRGDGERDGRREKERKEGRVMKRKPETRRKTAKRPETKTTFYYQLFFPLICISCHESVVLPGDEFHMMSNNNETLCLCLLVFLLNKVST